MAVGSALFPVSLSATRPAAGAVRWLPGALVLATALLGFSDRGWCEEFSTVSPTSVEVGSFYSGGTIHVHGLVHPDAAVVVRLLGPTEPQVFNRRERIYYIWGGVQHITFKNAPTSYIVLSSVALPALADPETRDSLNLGYPALVKRIRLVPERPETERLVHDFISLKKREGFYLVKAGAIELSDVRHEWREFDADVPLPANMPQGRMELEVMEFRQGRPIQRDVHAIGIERVGMPGVLGSLSTQHRLAFGFGSLLAMLLTGLLTGTLGQEKSKNARSPAWVMAKGTLGRTLEGLRIRILQPGEEHVARMRAKFQEFQTLLSLNNEVLELLAELEEESSWASFRHARVRMAIRALMDGSMDMVRTLNRLADNAYFDLETVVASIRSEVTTFLENLPEKEETRLTIPLADVRTSDLGQIGGKAANLARIECDLHLRVPSSFVVTTEAYRQFLESGGLADRLRVLLTPVRLDDLDDLATRSQQARTCIEESPVPPAVARAILEAARELSLEPGEGFAVRSSAVGEDSALSFAGQFESLLNVPLMDLPSAWKSVIASRYLARAIFYRRAAGLAEVDTPMAVLVQRMLAPQASGVLYTRRPDRPKESIMLIASAWGVGRDVSGGSAEADEWVLTRRRPFEVRERRVPRKTTRLAVASHSGIEAIELGQEEQSRPSLTDEEMFALAATGLSIEAYFGEAQDVEWALDAPNQPIILQARPLRTERVRVAGARPPADAAVILEGGRPVWAGRAVGPIWTVRSPDELNNVPMGSVLVLHFPLADAVRVLPRVCGVIVEQGSVTGHMASVLREFRVPSLFGLPEAMTRLEPGRLVSLDAAEHKVFDGVLWPELRGQIAVSLNGRQTAGLPETLAERLTTLSGGMLMTTWTCRSLHDVVRFSHEMAIRSMFDLGDELSQAKIGGVKKLESSEPYAIRLIDLGGGLRAGLEEARAVTPTQVSSIPFSAVWQGLSDKGFVVERIGDEGPASLAGLVMTTAFGGTEGRELGSPSYACVTSSYMNLNSRQAYHFAIVDAYVSEQLNSNHLSFRLKGGGAAEWQRVLRVRFMAEVLRMHHFTVSERGDLLNGWVRGLDRATSERNLAMIGRLLRFCAQLDMWMSRPDVVHGYVERFLEAEEQAQRQLERSGNENQPT